MSHDRLTKDEALQLISSVVDDEVDKATKNAFFKYIDNDKEVRREFESIKRIKKLVAERCPIRKAPDHLKTRIRNYLSEELHKEESNTSREQNPPAVDLPSSIPPESQNEKEQKNSGKPASSSHTWMYAAAASFLLIAIIWGIFYTNNNPDDTLASSETTYKVEEYVYKHFQDNDGRLIQPNISTASITDAEVSISDNYDMSLTVPPLSNSEFKGVVYSEFVPGFKAPLLEYYLPEEDQYIYIFAFPVEEMDKYGKLVRDQEAVKNCVKPSDFYVENVNGKHVVSWQWEGTWYAAISNHNGETLASLVEPLKYEK